ncbi:TPA: DUF1642 domain-containing protein [Streptococcus suis]|nr:DUF1642 domain-containing protein [Streptococcus suis]HEM6052593.1 DUF1642 domain-containing protein [Streptococcus suis]HEM6390532.1 DUF1642 domain-containing protein [Streptococcus suis]
MNTQEAIEIIEQDKIQVGRLVETNSGAHSIQQKVKLVDYVPLEIVVNSINQINEPRKVVVPKFVGEWIDTLDEHGLFGLNYDVVDESVWNWVYENYDYNVKKLHLAYLYGYEIEPEQLYTVEIPNPNLNAHTILQKTEKGLGLIVVTNARWLFYEGGRK